MWPPEITPEQEAETERWLAEIDRVISDERQPFSAETQDKHLRLIHGEAERLRNERPA